MYTLIDKNDKYIEMAEGENKMLVPSKTAIIVDDESTITTVKTIASRRTLADIDTSTPPTPTFQGKWLATYSDSHTESGECDSSSAITTSEISKTNLVSVEIGDCVTRINDSVFYRCSSLTSVTIPDSVTSIGQSAFHNCSSLTSVTIPNSVTTIGNRAFNSCNSLTSITINATTPPTLGQSVFSATNNCPIYVPTSSLSAYQSTSGWSAYASRLLAIPTN